MEISNECISSCLSGERVAQRKLYDILLPYLTTVCSRYLNDRSFINDVLQEAFIDLFKNLASYDIAKASIKTWAVKLAINQCMKANRKTERVDFSDAIIAQMPAILNSEILGRLEDEELLKCISCNIILFFTGLKLSEALSDAFFCSYLGD